MTINELIDKAHSAAKAKGFWDKERNIGELLMLIVSECGEALEAHRKGKRADWDAYNELRSNPMYAIHPEFLEANASNHFISCIKDTFEDELADIVIRIADLLGRTGHNKDRYDVVLMSVEPIAIPPNIGHALLMVSSCFTCTTSDVAGNVTQMNHDLAIRLVVAIAKAHNIDLDRHIELKLAYNATRPRLHGKAY